MAKGMQSISNKILVDGLNEQITKGMLISNI